MTSPRPLALTTHIRRQPEAAGEATPDDFLVLDLRNGRYYGLGTVGGFVWECLEAKSTVSEVIRKVVEKFEVDADTAAADTMEFLAEMLSCGLMVDSSAEGDD